MEVDFMDYIDIDELAKEIVEELEDGIDEMTAEAMEIAKQTATECAEALKKASPKDSGNYSRGWVVRKSGQGYVVYNKNNPSIEMPLEHGHIALKGKNAGQRVGKKEHIYRIADRYRNMFYNQCVRKIGR